jgi:PAS domain S-box-containing protein
MNNSYITIIKEKRTVLSRKRVPLNQNECTADFRIGVPFEQNLHKEDDELFYANHEFLHMAGYKSMDELFRLTQKRFRNLIRKDEQQQIETSIWKQIDSGNENDYIHFHLRKADGTYLSVLDHGRIVESQQYGRVFYVLFMDWEDMHIRYSDKFSE